MPHQQATFRRLKGHMVWRCNEPPSKENGLPGLTIYRHQDMRGMPTILGPS